MESLKLIDGKFNAEEAKEILMNLISSKIHFHAMKDFSTQERTGESVPASMERIKELQKTKEQIISIINKARKENIILEIHSSVNISYTEKKQTKQS